ncbi:MAG: protein jag [Anaerolineales bacterium]
MQSHEPTSIEVFASDVEEAIQRGLSQLALPREEVEIEILDEGSRGFLGLGARRAQVRLTPIRKEGQSVPAAVPVSPEVSQPKAPAEPQQPPASEGDEESRIIEICNATVTDLLEKMHVEAKVSTQFKPAEAPGRRPSLWVDISGKDLSILIGRQAETLQALEYITALILGKELEQSIPLTIDVEGYRQRRTAQLQRLAKRLAEQVASTGRRQALEPMPANERRIIHIALHNHPNVTTESVGEEPYRKVTILPKEH